MALHTQVNYILHVLAAAAAAILLVPYKLISCPAHGAYFYHCAGGGGGAPRKLRRLRAQERTFNPSQLAAAIAQEDIDAGDDLPVCL